jgi:hypothetical protein
MGPCLWQKKQAIVGVLRHWARAVCPYGVRSVWGYVQNRDTQTPRLLTSKEGGRRG